MTQTGGEGLVGQVSSQAQDAATTVQDKAVELKHEGGHKLGEMLDERTTEAGEQARQVARALRQSGQQMRSEGKGAQAVDLVDAAADRIERLGSYLGQMSGGEILRDVEDFARRRPWMVAGLGVVGGLVSARFLKASSERRYEGATWSAGRTPGVQDGSSTADGGVSGVEPARREPVGASG